MWDALLHRARARTGEYDADDVLEVCNLRLWIQGGVPMPRGAISGKEIRSQDGRFTKGNQSALRHGHARAHKPSQTYNSWAAMWQRCTSPSNNRFRLYGKRGIKVCVRWESFDAFLSDMGRRPKGKTLDRFPDADGNYEPGNCRWATASEQMSTRRKFKHSRRTPRYATRSRK
jgi:hypothetical protein